jgi:hypothetical protein
MRERRLRLLLLILLLAGGVAVTIVNLVPGGGVARGGSGSDRIGPQPISGQTSVAVSKPLNLPRPDDSYQVLGIGGGDLEVSNNSGNVTCTVVRIDLARLAVAGSDKAPCGTGVDGVLPVWLVRGKPFAPSGGLPSLGTGIDYQPISVATMRNGKVATGPPIMTVQQTSGGDQRIAYGGGSMWVVDCGTTKGAEAVQVSEATAAVRTTAKLPQSLCDNPMLAADADGLWIGTSSDSNPPAQIMHIAPDSNAVRIVHRGGRSVSAMVVDGDTLWADVTSLKNRKLTGQLWRFDGPTSKVAFHVSDHGLVSTDLTGSATLGLWSTVNEAPSGKSAMTFGQWSAGRWDEVVYVDPSTGATSIASKVHPKTIPGDVAAMSPVLYKGAIYLFDAPYSMNGQFLDAYLYRLSR